MSNGYIKYVDSDGLKLYTVVMCPEDGGKFPVVVIRTPYVDAMRELSDDEIVKSYLESHAKWHARGYATVVQHCRGCGKSEGECIPYINERADSRALYAWIREQDFYMGEQYLFGGSYLSSVHFCAAPWDDDIKGAVLEIQDVERYNIAYRNGFFKSGLHGNWYMGMYKKNSIKSKNYTSESYMTLPLNMIGDIAFGEHDSVLAQTLAHPDRNDAYWQTHEGGTDARDAVKHANIPILLRTGFYDIYTGGVFDMWHSMDEKTKQKSALIVTPNDHGDSHSVNSIHFPNSKASDAFPDYTYDWLDYVRGVGNAPVETGKITYYRLFEERYDTCAGDFTSNKSVTLPLGDHTVTYTYNPYNPPSFKGGLSANFGGAEYQDRPGSRYDIISVYTKPLERDAFVKGKMSARLTVSSDCEDTCFYVRVSIEKPDGDFGLRDDIRSLCYELGDYTPGEFVTLDFSFDEHAFKLLAGERLRVDIASADKAHYVRHTNIKGLFSEQTAAKIAQNTVDLSHSSLTLIIE